MYPQAKQITAGLISRQKSRSCHYCMYSWQQLVIYWTCVCTCLIILLYLAHAAIGYFAGEKSQAAAAVDTSRQMTAMYIGVWVGKAP